MPEPEDQQLLREFAQTHSETAFATLVARHVNLVYSAALRFCGNPHRAEEITQAVFIILARKAGSLGKGVVLPGWLYQTARLTAANVVKSEIRRQRREQEACMQSTLNEPDPTAWEQIAPLLDDAMGRLGETDRNAVVLRFFENKTAREVAAALQLSEAAAHKRVNRALDKLRKFFSKRGVTLATTVIAGAVSANSVHAAPVGLAKTISVVAVAKGAAASTSTLTLIKGALKIMAWTKAKTAVVAGVGVLLLAGTTTVSVKKYEAYQATLDSWRVPNPTPPLIDKTLPQVRILPTKFQAPVYGTCMASLNRWIGVRVPVSDLVRVAYNWPPGRIYFPAGEPSERYDYASTLQQNTEEALQLELKKKLGLVGRRETRDTPVWLLKVRVPGAPKLTPHKQGTRVWDWRDNRGHIWCIGEPLSSTPPNAPRGLTKYLELFLKMPVLDETGLKANYDVDLKWVENPQDANHDALRKALMDQVDLELVPDVRPIEVLVVEKAK